MDTITIRDWDEHFETSQSKRSTKKFSWLCVPLKLHGTGYLTLMSMGSKGREIYACWIAIAIVAAMQKRRGTIHLSLEALAMFINQPLELVVLTVKTLSTPPFDWIIYTGVLGEVSEGSPRGLRSTVHNITEHNSTKDSLSDVPPDEPKLQAPEHVEKAELLKTLMLQNDPKAKFTDKKIQAWANEVRLIVANDGRTLEEIETAIRFCQNDTFWRDKVLSMEKLRKQLPALLLKAKAAGPRKGMAPCLPASAFEDCERG